ncbi:MAG: hypothetical protein R3F44_07450 [Candidatus Competibacteraceae bacterium]
MPIAPTRPPTPDGGLGTPLNRSDRVDTPIFLQPPDKRIGRQGRRD